MQNNEFVYWFQDKYNNIDVNLHQQSVSYKNANDNKRGSTYLCFLVGATACRIIVRSPKEPRQVQTRVLS